MSQTTTCLTCGAAFAPDQRYCLGCGVRVAEPRLDFLTESERADAEAVTAMPAAAAAAAPSRLDKIGGPMGVAAAMLVTLGVGFLIGRAAHDAPPQKAPVVTVERALASGTPTTARDLADDDATAGGASANERATSRR